MDIGAWFGRRRTAPLPIPAEIAADGQGAAIDDAALDAVVAVSHISKRLSGRLAVDDVSFDVRPGELFALIGPSGSGKTTTVRIICGVYTTDSGSVCLLGQERRPWSRSLKNRFGYMPQTLSLYPRMTAAENLRYIAALHGMRVDATTRRLAEVLDLVNLVEQRDRLAGEMSGGQRRRLALAVALMHDPELLFVDEPTAGLDPALRARLWAYFRQMCASGRSVIVTTQFIDEAELTDRVAIMRAARLTAIGSPANLARAAFGGEIVELRSNDLTALAARALSQLEGVHDVEFVGLDTLRVIVDVAEVAAPRLLAELARHGSTVHAIGLRRPRFEDVFLRLTGVAPEPESAAGNGAKSSVDASPAHRAARTDAEATGVMALDGDQSEAAEGDGADAS